MEHLLPLSEDESVCSSIGSVPSESDDSLFKVKRELRTLGSTMQQAHRRQATVHSEQSALTRPHQDTVHNLTTIIANLNSKLTHELGARDEILHTVAAAKEKVTSDVSLVCEACAAVDRRVQRFAGLLGRDAAQRRQAAVEAEGAALVLAEQRRRSRLLVEEIDSLRGRIVLQEQEVFDLNKAVRKIRENPQWEILGLQFMRQWVQDKDKRLISTKHVYTQSHKAHHNIDRVPGKYNKS